MELIIEIIFELYLELYLELMLFIVPGEGKTSKKHRNLAILIALTVLFVTLALLVWGCILVSDHNNYFGFIPILVAIAISAAQIVAGFILHNKNTKC